MNKISTPDEQPDEVDERYRRLSDRQPTGPSEAVRRAVLRHAAGLSAKGPRRRVATYGGLAAAAALTGLLVVPHFLMPTPVAQLPALPVEPDTGASPPAPILPPAVRNDGSPPAAGAPALEQNSIERSRAAVVPRAASMVDPATALREAARRGDAPALHRLLAEKLDIDARDANGRTALMLAVLKGHSEAVDTLLAAGANPNATDASGTTPLQAAFAGAHSAIATALEQSGAR
jgi:hypothetical protein